MISDLIACVLTKIYNINIVLQFCEVNDSINNDDKQNEDIIYGCNCVQLFLVWLSSNIGSVIGDFDGIY